MLVLQLANKKGVTAKHHSAHSLFDLNQYYNPYIRHYSILALQSWSASTSGVGSCKSKSWLVGGWRVLLGSALSRDESNLSLLAYRHPELQHQRHLSGATRLQSELTTGGGRTHSRALFRLLRTYQVH